jgi:hypothetical protein
LVQIGRSEYPLDALSEIIFEQRIFFYLLRSLQHAPRMLEKIQQRGATMAFWR